MSLRCRDERRAGFRQCSELLFRVTAANGKARLGEIALRQMFLIDKASVVKGTR